MKQLHLFTTVTSWVELEADSPKKAFYRLMIEECQGQYSIVKESGCLGKVRDRRAWPMPSKEKAIKKFNRILQQKTDRSRGSPRKYRKLRAGRSARSMHKEGNDSMAEQPLNEYNSKK